MFVNWKCKGLENKNGSQPAMPTWGWGVEGGPLHFLTGVLFG